jgi:hypothetical protein
MKELKRLKKVKMMSQNESCMKRSIEVYGQPIDGKANI